MGYSHHTKGEKILGSSDLRSFLGIVQTMIEVGRYPGLWLITLAIREICENVTRHQLARRRCRIDLYRDQVGRKAKRSWNLTTRCSTLWRQEHNGKSTQNV